MASILFIRRFIASQNRVVEYRPNGMTRCPVCEFCGLEHVSPTVTKTAGDLRYCMCPQCLADFQARGPLATELKSEKQIAESAAIEIEKEVVKKKEIYKKKKKGRQK